MNSMTSEQKGSMDCMTSGHDQSIDAITAGGQGRYTDSMTGGHGRSMDDMTAGGKAMTGRHGWPLDSMTGGRIPVNNTESGMQVSYSSVGGRGDIIFNNPDSLYVFIYLFHPKIIDHALYTFTLNFK